MLRLAVGTVQKVLEKQTGIQILEVRTESIAGYKVERVLSFLQEDYNSGDLLLINTTAVHLELGTGGYHFVVGKVTQPEESDVLPNEWGHVMKMRYSPWQLAVDAVEEQASPYHPLFVQEDLSLEGTPVLISELHSLLPVAVLALHKENPNARIVYVMPDGASLPIALSQHVHQLKAVGSLAATVTTGHAWGGDRESLTIHSGLLAARHVEHADIIICMLGPGVAGTGTSYGFSGIQLAEVIHAVSTLGGTPIFIPRISFGDTRTRHYGVSHHTISILNRFALCPVLVTIPIFGDERDEVLSRQMKTIEVAGKHIFIKGKVPDLSELALLEKGYGLSFSTMGRNWQEDPAPFQTAWMAADFVGKSVGYIIQSVIDAPHSPASLSTLEELGLYLTRNEGKP
ncbi:DUF3866 family protein [Brevibacillus formosus]|uniref:DUF3866 family protein n=1 Tax=Brevibacillus TaxID=55080 RepID=UPI000D108372|nr:MULTISPECIES: DUF3866 family protein [Brevibacillus]MBG9940549.1 hypothetical protein [Brevibacillus formosus]MED1944459.1 DUF3866 family protein [Brevibacillus formosus]MED1999169.1 DUF3866 family protein [Brevibacillus formosus]MED2082694.1 DUF3866 family protein [Brevibacillus formosus]PSK14779.1 DUF3866 domain-containing protein [Brevibacillus sp. NRRL NRS-603]